MKTSNLIRSGGGTSTEWQGVRMAASWSGDSFWSDRLGGGVSIDTGPSLPETEP